jgi:hypothetical protein
LAEHINSHKIRIETDNETDKERIGEEIGELKDAAPDEEKKKKLVPKDVIKENIGRSPDDLDCLIMRMWFVLKRERAVNPFTNNIKKSFM